MIAERPAAGYRVVVAGYIHRKVFLEVEGRPHVSIQTATTGPITLTTDANGAFSANPTTPTLPPAGDAADEPYYSASATVYSASGAIVATDDKTSPVPSFAFAFSVPFQLEPGRLAIGGHVTEDWSGRRAAGYSLRVVGFTKAEFRRTAGFGDGKPMVITEVNDTPPIALTTDANGHFFTDPETPPLPTLRDPTYELGIVTHGANVTVSAHGIALATVSKEATTTAVGFAIDVAGWASIGPKNFTCVIVSLAVHPTIPSIIYAGAQYGGVWKTTDAGATWRPTMDAQSNLYVGAVGLCTAHPQVVYAAMHSSAEFSPTAGLFRSADGGVSWQARTAVSSVCNAGTQRSLQMAVHPTNPDIVYLAGDRALHRSDDGGLTWPVRDAIIDGVTQRNSYGILDGAIVDVKLDPDQPDTIYIAVTGRGVLSSTDGGATWTRLGASLQFPVQYQANGQTQTRTVGLDGSYRCALALGGPINGRRLVAKVQGTILISDDRGRSWRVVPGTDHGYEPDSPDWDSCVGVMPGNRDVIVAGGDGMTASFDGGTTWSHVAALHEDQQSIAFVPNQSAFYFSNDGLIGSAHLTLELGQGLKLVPKFATQTVSTGLVASQCFNVSVSQTAPVVAGCSTYHTGIVRTGREQLDQWEYLQGAEGGLFEIDPTDANKLFCAPWAQPHLRMSTDGGSSFTSHDLMFRSATGQDQAAYPVSLGIRPDDGSRLYAGAFFGWLYFSVDGGNHWDHVKDAAGNPLLPTGGTERNDQIGGFAYAPSNPAVVYAGTTNGRVWRTTSAATSSAGWQQLSSPSPITDRLWAIAVHPTDPNTIYVGYAGSAPASNRVWRGTQQPDGTFAWALASGSAGAMLPAMGVYTLVCDPAHPSHVFAATSLGVYSTADAGATWYPLGGGLPNTRIVDLRLRRRDHTLYAAALGRGIFRWPLL
ncbi:MAG: WD40/YVTN/BNR-like repeat-containing protein [Acidobacteriota bacterium]